MKKLLILSVSGYAASGEFIKRQLEQLPFDALTVACIFAAKSVFCTWFTAYVMVWMMHNLP